MENHVELEKEVLHKRVTDIITDKGQRAWDVVVKTGNQEK